LGAVQPFERLRAIARHGGDDRLLVAEAADCLGEFDDDPAALVVTCRRLLSHHPERAPLWWLCARVLAAPEPSEAAWDAEAVVRDDHTADRLSGVLPFPADHPVAVLGWPTVAGAALALRPDLEVLVVRDTGTPHGGDGDERWRARLARSDASARPVDLIEAVAHEPSHLLVEVVGGGPEQLLVSEGTADAIATLSRPGLVVWLVAGVGRVLPARLFDAMVRTLGDPEDRGLELLDVQAADRIAGPTGLVRPEQLSRRVDCPVAPELLRLS
jgi:hypothetical protein